MNKILVIAPYFWPASNGGGGQVSIENMVNHLSDSNNITVLCNTSFESNLKGISHSSIFQNVDIKYYAHRNFLSLFNLIYRQNFDIIYFNSFFSPLCILIQLFAVFNNRLIKVVSPKGELYSGALEYSKFVKLIWLRVFKLLFRRTNLHATSSHELGLLQNIFPNNSIKLARDIPSSINVNVEEYKVGEVFKIVFSSSIVPKKNLEFLISTLYHIEFPVIFDIWGQAFDPLYLETIISKLKKLPSNIMWKYNGALPFSDAKYIFKSYDLFVFPTLGENYGHVIYESLSCGCPVLLSEGTTPWENLEKYQIGINISLQAFGDWVNRLRDYLIMPIQTRLLQRERCINFIAKEYDLDIIILENKNLFK